MLTKEEAFDLISLWAQELKDFYCPFEISNVPCERGSSTKVVLAKITSKNSRKSILSYRWDKDSLCLRTNLYSVEHHSTRESLIKTLKKQTKYFLSLMEKYS